MARLASAFCGLLSRLFFVTGGVGPGLLLGGEARGGCDEVHCWWMPSLGGAAFLLGLLGVVGVGALPSPSVRWQDDWCLRVLAGGTLWSWDESIPPRSGVDALRSRCDGGYDVDSSALLCWHPRR